MNKLERLKHPLYCITSEEFSLGRSSIVVVKEMIDAGVKLLQYREKGKSAKAKYQDCLKIREMTKGAGVTFIVNDDVALALAIGADGVHIGQDDLPISVVRKMLGEDYIIGVSTHSPEQARAAIDSSADYIGVGPIYPTKTKKDVGPAVGLEYLDYVVKNVQLPFVAIGGIKVSNMTEVLQHGAKCVAMVTEIVGAQDIKGKIKEIYDILREKGV